MGVVWKGSTATYVVRLITKGQVANQSSSELINFRARPVRTISTRLLMR